MFLSIVSAIRLALSCFILIMMKRVSLHDETSVSSWWNLCLFMMRQTLLPHKDNTNPASLQVGTILKKILALWDSFFLTYFKVFLLSLHWFIVNAFKRETGHALQPIQTQKTGKREVRELSSFCPLAYKRYLFQSDYFAGVITTSAWLPAATRLFK